MVVSNVSPITDRCQQPNLKALSYGLDVPPYYSVAVVDLLAWLGNHCIGLQRRTPVVAVAYAYPMQLLLF